MSLKSQTLAKKYNALTIHRSVGVQATVSADYVWQIFETQAKLNKATVSGPHTGRTVFNLTDADRPYPPYCQYTRGEENTAPLSSSVHIRTNFALTGAGKGTIYWLLISY